MPILLDNEASCQAIMLKHNYSVKLSICQLSPMMHGNAEKCRIPGSIPETGWKRVGNTWKRVSGEYPFGNALETCVPKTRNVAM